MSYISAHVELTAFLYFFWELFLPDLRSSIDQIRYFVSQVVKFSRRKIEVYFNLELSNVLKIKQASIFY